jgi:hypothetical protein
MDKKTCATCARGINITFSRDILCRKKGAVDPEYHCFAYMPKDDLYDRKLNCICCDNFSLCTGQEDIGNCKILTVRLYNGKVRKACSLFVRKVI